MTVALQSPGILSALVCVDNAPVAARLSDEFGNYIQGFRAIQEARPKNQAGAEVILQRYEQVSLLQTRILGSRF